MLPSPEIPRLGFGLGLRQPHYDHVLATLPPVDWFEVVSENFMEAHAGHWELLADIRTHYPLVLHGVGLSIGSSDSLDQNYLAKLAKLAEATRPAFISDHLCFTGVQGINSHDLLPVPYTREALHYITERVQRVQDFLGRQIALENPSTYAQFASSCIPEWEFLAELAERADCLLLLDVNNVYVSAFNHGMDAQRYIDALPTSRVAYLHLAGHRHKGTHIIDTHDEPVSETVWELYRYTLTRHSTPNTLLEWDGNIPEFSVLEAELAKARGIADDVQRIAA